MIRFISDFSVHIFAKEIKQKFCINFHFKITTNFSFNFQQWACLRLVFKIFKFILISEYVKTSYPNTLSVVRNEPKLGDFFFQVLSCINVYSNCFSIESYKLKSQMFISNFRYKFFRKDFFLNTQYMKPVLHKCAISNLAI